MHTRIQLASIEYEAAFLAAVRRSSSLHRPWVKPPANSAAFRTYLAKQDGSRNIAFFAFSDSDELVGVVNVSEIVRGLFQSAYLGYYAFSPHDRRGYMTGALATVASSMFRKQRLHRLEANIQPANRTSIALVKRLGFRKEGVSPRYLKVGGAWRDHERWAVTREEWSAPEPRAQHVDANLGLSFGSGSRTHRGAS
jgi:[ribosomal protein S5]-alanine N-acetyltransferase